jgi:hypothetical protein
LLLATPALLAPLLAPGQPANADPKRSRMVWGGAVDDTVDVMVRRGEVKLHTVKGKRTEEEKHYFLSKMPDKPVRVRLTRVRGRGRAEVFQQPSKGNGYTAGVRVTDAENGRSNYEFVLAWD